MSFSAEVKEELLGHTANTRHCQLAGIAAIITSIGYVGETEGGGKALYLLSDNAQVLAFWKMCQMCASVGVFTARSLLIRDRLKMS